MAAVPVNIPASALPKVPRRSFVLTERRLGANRRNAARSTGPRSPAGKARVARNAIKHGFFVAQERWAPMQHREFEELCAGLRDDSQPQGRIEESCVATIAESYVRMAAMLRYENIAASKYHQQQDRAVDQRIAAADATEAARLREHREELRRAGLWRPTIPGPREVTAIARYSGHLERTIRHAVSELENLKALRTAGVFRNGKALNQSHSQAPRMMNIAAVQESRKPSLRHRILQEQTHSEGAASIDENAKTNPLSSMFIGNRHQRRRAKALAANQRRRV